MTAPCVVTWWENLTTPLADSTELLSSWELLFEKFSKRMPFVGTTEHPGWSPAEFDPPRRALENVRRVFALCLDYDGGTTIADALERWAGVYGFLHTSRSHTHDAPRFRVILPLARPVSPFEFRVLWDRIAPHAGEVDQAPKDPSRFWFVPGAPREAPYEAIRMEGDPLDPDAWLSRPEPQREAPRPAAPRRDAPDVERRALAYIDRMPAAISGSGGHAATFDVAVRLARGFALSEGDTFRILRDHYNPRCQPPWSEKELRHKAASAAASERVPFGFMLEDDRRDWRQWLPADEAPRSDGQMPAIESAPEAPQAEARDTRSAVERFGLVSMRSLMEQIAEELNRPKPRPGVCTGSGDLNTAIGGFRPGHVTVFGAKRGWGKTSYGNLVVSRAVPEYRVLMFAGEDAAQIYGRRFLAMRANLNAMRLRDGACDKADWPRIWKAIADAPANPFFVRVEGRPVEWIAEVIRAVAAEGPLDLVIADYLQCIKAGKRLQDRRNEVTYVFQTMSNAIKSVNAAGLIFSQLKRTDRPEPEVEDLKESGDIEDGADHILLGWKTDSRSGGQIRTERKVKLGKNKDGVEANEVSEVLMRWNARTAAFEYTPASDGADTYREPVGRNAGGVWDPGDSEDFRD